MGEKCIINRDHNGNITSMNVVNKNYGKRPLQEKRNFRNLITNLMNTKLVNKVFTDWSEFKKAAGVQKSTYVGNEINGAVSVNNGYIFINPNSLNAETAVHEFAHLWFDYLKYNNSELYSEIQNVILKDEAAMNDIRRDVNYSHLKTDEQRADELFARALGARAEKYANKGKYPELVVKFWNWVKSLFGKGTPIEQWTSYQWKNATLFDVASVMAKSLIDGKVRIETAVADRISEELLDDIKYSIIGELGASNIQYYNETLQQAKEMESQGVDYETIDEKTGWYKFKGDWKTLVDDVYSKYNLYDVEVNKPVKLVDILGDNILMELYPDMSDIEVVFVNSDYEGLPSELRNDNYFENYDGIYYNKRRGGKGGERIIVNVGGIEKATNPFEKLLRYTNSQERERNVGREQLGSKRVFEEYREIRDELRILSKLFHEIQHAVQDRENHSEGGNEFTILDSLSESVGIPYKDYKNNSDFLEELIRLKKNGVINDDKYNIILSHLRAIVGDNREFLLQEYNKILGEVDARIVEQEFARYFLNIGNKGYSKSLNEAVDRMSIDKDDLYYIKKAKEQFSLIEHKQKQLEDVNLDFLETPYVDALINFDNIVKDKNITKTRCK